MASRERSLHPPKGTHLSLDEGHTMSLLEHTIWTVLGYGAMPFIFLSGFVAVAVTCCALLNAFGVQSAEK
ncbi:hypothetical protein JUNP479_0348 [Aeromonas jandaei]|nr:hypothetical protein JUNP479_0348 [Aeromonas jandaei]